MSVRFSVKMDGNFVKSRPRQVRRKRLEIQRLRSMSSTESDGITTTDHLRKNKKTTTTKTTKQQQQQKKKKLRIKVVSSCESAPLLDDESTVEERLQCASHGSISVCGRRREMEDAVSVIPGFLSEIDFFGVYDGHGGSRVAQECSEKLHRLLAEEMMMMIDQRSDGGGGDDDEDHHHDFDEDWEKILVSCFSKMDEEVSGSRGGGVGLEVDDMKSIGSTAVVALIGKEKIIVANCGDSRAVMSRGGVAVPLSRDHKELEADYSYLLRETYSVNASKMKPDRSDELERVEAAGGRVINWNGYRVLGVLATSRSIGDHYLKPYVISVPEVLVTERTKSDEFLILASDGLWDVLSNEQACDVTRRCLGGRIMRRINKSNAANRLVDGATRAASKSNAASRFVDGAMRAAAVLTELAIARGSKDNISVVVIELNKMDKMNRDSSS